METLEALTSWDDDPDGRLRWADMLQTALPGAVLERLEELMRTSRYEYQSGFAKKSFAHGHKERREEARLEAWIRRAATADPIDDVLDDE